MIINRINVYLMMKSLKKRVPPVLKMIVITVCIFIAVNAPLKASMSAGLFGGISGSSMVIFLADYLGDMNGSLVNQASDDGLLTGELGLGVDVNFSKLGFRFEGLMGYYKYNVIKQPNTAYMMYLAGGEVYLSSEDRGNGYILGAGYGKFNGSQWGEVMGQKVDIFKNHKGYAVWGTLGHRWDGFEMNFRLRYHRFTMINETDLESYEGRDYKRLRSDYVIVFRMCYWLNFI